MTELSASADTANLWTIYLPQITPIHGNVRMFLSSQIEEEIVFAIVRHGGTISVYLWNLRTISSPHRLRESKTRGREEF